ncbi:nicotinate-nucleotide--dimethylbenzimidazole phosphoribosyltransferase, partial [Amycolatopsis sp. NPDC000740]
MPRFAIPVPDAAARATALERLDGLVKPVGSLGRLEELAAWLSAAHGVV